MEPGQAPSYLPHRHPAAVHRENLVVRGTEAPLVLADGLGFEFAFPVAQNADRQWPIAGQSGAAALAIAVADRRLRTASADSSTKAGALQGLPECLQDLFDRFRSHWTLDQFTQQSRR